MSTLTPVTLRVWVVDDESGIANGVHRSLESHQVEFPDLNVSVHYAISLFETGEAMLAQLNTDRPDILLLDNQLPGISGSEILAQLYETKQGILTIIMTAYGTFDKVVKVTKLGAYDFLPKPFTPQELRYVIQKASRDVILTERSKKLEQEKRQIRFEFISVLSHELKSPLNTTEGYIDMLQQRSFGETLTSYDPMLERMKQRLKGMRQLIQDLLDLTQIESGQKKRDLKNIDLALLIQECLQQFTEQAQKGSVTLQFNPTGASLFYCDAREISILLNNLISNAIKYNRPQGRVEVQLVQSDSHVSISVSDTGIGLSDDDKNALFKDFSRIKNESTRRIEGTGLGLSIVKKIALLYDGAVSVQSVRGQGATFSILLKGGGAQQ